MLTKNELLNGVRKVVIPYGVYQNYVHMIGTTEINAKNFPI